MRVKKSFNNIDNHYKRLVEMTNNHLFVGITNEWLLDNYYLIIDQKSRIKNFSKDLKGIQYLEKNINLIKVIEDILIKYNYRVNEKIVISELIEYQKKNSYYFLYEELRLVPTLIAIIIINKISEVCTSENDEIIEKKQINQYILAMKKEITANKSINLVNYFKINEQTSSNYIVYFNEQLKELGSNSSEIFKQFVTNLSKSNLELRNIIYNEHLSNAETSVFVTNAFFTLKNINLISVEKLFDNVSEIEKILNYDSVYAKTSDATKNIYRKQLVKFAKKSKMSCIDYANFLIAKKEHIGKYLFTPKNQKLMASFYLLVVLLTTISISLLLSQYFIYYRIIGFLVLIIPVSEFVIVILNKIFIKFFPCQSLMKMDYSKGIPNDQETMVVVPTIIKNAKKINLVFDNLEMFYLSNKTKNLYFTLLGDCAEHNEKTSSDEQEIVEAGQLRANELNKKYGKKMFFFVYRRRVFNPKEGTWLGFERKRGALLHFNDLLLGNLTEKQKNDYFVIHTFNDFKKQIKYVITLDVDTKLVLNSARSLVETMAHPLNKPILNEAKNKVISGYGIMQPKVGVDIDATNKSLFTQIYAGIGGFDPYNSPTPNFYQDVFGEGSFIGKGIYDLKVFQTILKTRFPNDLILSHDLIEGSHIRCANISDIELIDDFPSKFLADASRRSRWARGDIQIIGWLKNKVKNQEGKTIKNEISLISKWKIFDNVRRGLLDFSLLFIILYALFAQTLYPRLWILFVVFITALPSLFYFFQLFRFNRNGISLKYYNALTYGSKAIILRTITVFSCIPFNCYLYIDSFIRSVYRMLISKKHLLNWITTEDAEKSIKSGLINMIRRFWVNYAFGFFIIGLSLITKEHILLSISLAIVFMFAAVLAHIMSQDISKITKNVVYDKDEKYVYEIARRTWDFFYDRLIPDYNYLIPDNFQLNRNIKDDYKTSPTNIGLSLNAVVSACELDFITVDQAKELINQIIKTIEKLKKWNGHLYNWYNISTLEIMQPNFISSVDSGNFVACLIVVKEFIKKNALNDNLVKRIETLIRQTIFTELYTEDDVFSIGFHDDEERLNPYCYNKFASESRILSFVSIAKGDVPSHHWFQLDKTLTAHNDHKGLVSWYGTAFEYFMPLIFMPSYPNTLLDETYYFAYEVQKDYIKEIDKKLPWGISESAYNELDDAQNYKYRAFGIPYLKLKEEPIGKTVISPYSSILVIAKYPNSVIKNMKKLRSLGLEGEYGFYESYDVDDKTPVYSYYAHHQGMILSCIANYLKNNVIQNLFMADVSNRTFDILNKEKVQIKPTINLKEMRYKKYSYEKEQFVNDMRIFKHVSTMPELSVLSNAKYSLIINDRGNGFSRYRTIQLNRYRKITEQDYGLFLYIKDLDSDYTWSNTYAPMNVKPEKYEVVFNLDRIKFVRVDVGIVTTTEIVVAKTDNAEIRKITFRNSGKKTRNLELTSYMEPILCDNNDDVAHRVFNNMFIRSEYDRDTNSIIMRRKSRTSPSTYFLSNRLFIENPKEEFQFETDRTKFIGRGNKAISPLGLDQKLSGYIGTSLDPIISLRNRITIERGKEKTVYLIVGFGKSREQVMNIINTYKSKAIIDERAFQVATIMANVTNKMVNITGNDMRMYNTMLNFLYQTSKISINEQRVELLRQNALSQASLWRLEISGDRPVVFADIHSIENLSIVKELLHAFEYYKSKSIFIDLVFLNAEDREDAKVIAQEIEDEKYHMEAINSFNKIPGRIFVIERNEINHDEYILLGMIARMMIDTDKYLSLYQYVDELQQLNTISNLEIIPEENSAPIKYDKKDLTYFNEYGGFINNGKEYFIVNKNTPTVWSNVIANETFGTVITNNNCGFTYYQNSREFKLTSWTNDTLLNDLSEGIRINNNNISYDQVKHGFGYSMFYAKIKNFAIEYTTFVSEKDPIKIYKYKIKNTDKIKHKIDFNFYINPTLGVSEDKTGRHLLCEYDENNNFISIRNVYNPAFNHLHVFMSSTKKLSNYSIERILYKEISTGMTINPGEEKEIAFTLGSSIQEEMFKLTKKYQNINNVNLEFDKVKSSWQNRLGKIQIKTPEKSFDYMINGWLLYQSIASRLYAKAGYYQVGGAFGFRDQLQDAMNICTVYPEITRQQIIINASHQFSSGDVLHWWHEHNHQGLRSKYKDDYLWLIYAASEYVKISGDYKILGELIPYIEGEELKPGEMEKGINYRVSNIKDSLFGHIEKALTKSMNEIGENGLPLMGGGDWNDGMNEVGKKGKGTSVWLGFFLSMMIEKFIEFTNIYDSKYDVANFIEFNNKLKTSLRDVAWDGDYYLRAFFDNGNKLGSKENDECQIDLLSQSFAILSGIADKNQTKSILKAVDENLVDKDHKIVKLLTPAFEDSLDNPGYIMNYPKGIRENGGQYTHAVAWYIMALIKSGLNDKAFNIFQMINPINHTLSKTNVDTYQVEPYVVAADIYSNNDLIGRGGWTWYTGSAAWLYRVGLLEIIGFNKIDNKLYLNPHIPKEWKEFEIDYQLDDSRYHILVKKGSAKKIVIDDKIIKTDYIPLNNKKNNYNIIFTMEE